MNPLKDIARFKPHPKDIDKVRITVRCTDCKKDHVFDMPEADWFLGLSRLRDNDLMQHAFPNLSPDNRETLISRICPRCWAGLED
jgi:hypothetical protein